MNSVRPPLTAWTATPADRHAPVAPVISEGVVLPPWSEVISFGQIYLDFVESQPFPMFESDSFISSLEGRSSELMYALVAVAVHFSREPMSLEVKKQRSEGYSDTAHALAFARVSGNRVELSTIQTLLLLSHLDILCVSIYDTNLQNYADYPLGGNGEKFAIHANLGLTLVQHAVSKKLETSSLTGSSDEELIRCSWNAILVQSFYNGADMTSFAGLVPRLPASPPIPQSLVQGISIPMHISSDPKQGIMAVLINLSSAWSKTCIYIQGHGRLGSRPIWSMESEYSKQMFHFTQIGAKQPQIHRFKSVKMEQLRLNRDYWAPWLLTRFVYHTIVCLLNHPLMIMMQVQGYDHVPEIYLQQTSFQISHHTHWVKDLLSIVESNDLVLTDPLAGYCVAAVATIELHLSFSTDTIVREEKRKRFIKCVEFVEKTGEVWPAMAMMVIKLKKLEESLTASRKLALGNDRSVYINLDPLWDILDIRNIGTESPNDMNDSSVSTSRFLELNIPPAVTPAPSSSNCTLNIGQNLNEPSVMGRTESIRSPIGASTEVDDSLLISPTQFFDLEPFELNDFNEIWNI
ncbi:C6 transcription factor [Penicillium brevicompactum]|uniref:C6 transcription factor n=1 Tax=Penicillium brevicompactum TaxID=5074 RepID=A0A9W9RDH4_PENBR|nr:C6 transcription factor [Penicillium brevicompactum]